MIAFEIDQLAAERRAAGRAYHEFLRMPALSAGLYALPAGGRDQQQPHNEDEIRPRGARARPDFVAGASLPVPGPGSLVYVPAHDEHRFHDIEEEFPWRSWCCSRRPRHKQKARNACASRPSPPAAWCCRWLRTTSASMGPRPTKTATARTSGGC